MSEEFLTGQEATEAAHDRFPIHADQPPEDVLSEADAAAKLSEAPAGFTPEERPIVHRQYYKRNEDGTFAKDDGGLFQPVEERGWVTAEEAGRDLAAARQGELEELARQERDAIQQATDELRREPFQSGQPEQPQQPAQAAESLEDWGQRIQQQRQVTNDEVRTHLAKAVSDIDGMLADPQTDQQTRSFLETKRAEAAQKLSEAQWAHAFEQHPELVGMVEAEIASKISLSATKSSRIR
jgi:hypothetical protein